jgi:maltose O-acetyltransferase
MENNKIVFEEGRLPKKKVFLFCLLAMRFPLVLPFIKRIVIRYFLPHCKNINFLPGFNFYYGNIYAKNVDFGDAFIMDYAPVYIGEKTTLGWQCMIATGNHDNNNFNTVIAKPVRIGKNVTIYSRVIVLGGVRIGDNTVVGAGSVVVKDLPANCFAAGNPAKVIKQELYDK